VNKRRYSADFEDLIADVHGVFGQSIASTGKLVARVLDSNIGGNVELSKDYIPSTETVTRTTILKAQLIKDQLAIRLSKCTYLGLGCDKTTRYFDRSFFEGHIFAWDPIQETKIHKLWKYVELNPTITSLELLNSIVADVEDRQTRLEVNIH
jgi:hypothetical protein